jgi:DNA-binding MarR family transcriptional regulator
MTRTDEPERLGGSGFGRTRTAALAKQIGLVRTARNSTFNDNLFGEPAWDILLLLYVALHEGDRLTVGAVCNESGVPDTTALRWIDRLVELGLVRRDRNPVDNRSSFIELEIDGIKKMDDVLAKMCRDFSHSLESRRRD